MIANWTYFVTVSSTCDCNVGSSLPSSPADDSVSTALTVGAAIEKPPAATVVVVAGGAVVLPPLVVVVGATVRTEMSLEALSPPLHAASDDDECQEGRS